METNRSSDPSNRVTDEHPSDPPKKTDEHNSLQPSPSNTSTPPRTRSRSVLQWMQKPFANVTLRPFHKHSPSRPRAATTTLHSTANSSERSPPISQSSKENGRSRSSTLDSIGSTGKKKLPHKKTISDTDAQAQQSPSIFQYVFGR